MAEKKKLEKEVVIADAQRLFSFLNQRVSRYNINLNRMETAGSRRRVVTYAYSVPPRFTYLSGDEDTGVLVGLNPQRSGVNTIVSKMSQSKVRPFLNAIAGGYKTYKVCRNGQTFFDVLFDKDNVYYNGATVVADALIYEYGAMWVNDFTKCIELLPPWEYFYSPAEFQQKRFTRVMIRKEQYPLSLLDMDGKLNDRLKSEYANNREAWTTYWIYFDLCYGHKYEFAGEDLLAVTPIDYTVPPVVQLWYEPPQVGGFGVSFIDATLGIAFELDDLERRIHDAFQVSPFNTIFYPTGATAANNIKASILTNQAGIAIGYTPVPGVNGGGSGVTVATPPAINEMYLQREKELIQMMFEQEGVSQLSAQSKKPAGADSGKALDTLQDVESERFNRFLQNYIQFFIQLTDTYIRVMPKNEDVLPSKIGRAGVKWSDIVEQRDNYSISYNSASALSKDASKQMEQIEKMVSMKMMTPEQAALYMEIPDTQGANSVLQASKNDCMRIVERAIETGDTEYYEVVNVEQLYTETVNMLLRLDAVDEDPKSDAMRNLVKLLHKVKDNIDAVMNAAAPPPPPPQPAGAAGGQPPAPPTEAATALPVEPGPPGGQPAPGGPVGPPPPASV